MSAVESADSRPALRYGERRTALLAAAVRVGAEQGLRNLTYRAVAREAGVAHGLVAHHFGTRDVLLEEALQYSLAKSVPAISARPGSGDLDALFEGIVEMVQTLPHDLAFQYELILESRRRPELRPHVQSLYRTFEQALADELACGEMDFDQNFVHLVFAALDGLVFQQLSIADPERTDAALAHLRTLLALAGHRST